MVTTRNNINVLLVLIGSSVSTVKDHSRYTEFCLEDLIRRKRLPYLLPVERVGGEGTEITGETLLPY